MEFVIGIVVIYFVLQVIRSIGSGKTKSETRLKDAINKAFIEHVTFGHEWLETKIQWEAAEIYARDRAARLFNDNYYFKTNIMGEDIAVLFYHSRMNGTVTVYVRRVADLAAEANSEIDELMSPGRRKIINEIIKRSCNDKIPIESDFFWQDAMGFASWYSSSYERNKIYFFMLTDSEDRHSEDILVYFRKNLENDKFKVDACCPYYLDKIT